MSRSTLKILVSCALAGVFTAPLNVLAAPVGNLEDRPSRVVAYGDLDLSRGSGVATLYARINTAARRVCEPTDDLLQKLSRDRLDCRGDAIARAVSEVNSPALTSYYQAKAR
jgi:UrcA family protein